MKRIGAILLALAILLPPTPGPAADRPEGEPAGTMLRLRGDVTIVGTDGAARTAGPNAVLFVGDRVLTGTATRFELELLDGAVLTLGDESDLTVDRMAYDPRIGTGALDFTLNRGVFRFVSGALGRSRSERRIALHTPMGTIGLRGADAWGEQAGETLRTLLLDGSLYVDTAFGRIEALDPRSGIQVDGPLVAPRTLPPIGEQDLGTAIARISF